MHELSLTQSIVEVCDERAEGARVRRVTLEIGRLAAVMPEALRFCFDACSAGTLLDGAELEIVDVDGRGRCRACGATVSMRDFLARCPCGSIDVELVVGDGIRVRSMELM